MREARRGILNYLDDTPTTAHVQPAELCSGECLWRNAASQRRRWQERTIAQNVAKPGRIRPEDGADEAEEVRADAVRDEANDDG